MHRAGSSLLSSFISSLGYSLGVSENKSKDIANPLGYFENDKLTDLHDRMLEYNGFGWDTAVGTNLDYTQSHMDEYLDIISNDFIGDKIVIKDPRLSFFNEFIKTLSKNINANELILFCTRDREEVISSLMKAQHRAKSICENIYDNTHKCLTPNMLKISYNDHMINQKETQMKICEYINEKYIESNLVDPSLYRNKK